MIRKTILWGIFVTALLLLTLPGYFLQERQGPPEPAVGADVINRGGEAIWLTADTAGDVLLRLQPRDSGDACRLRVEVVRVYDTDPTVDPPPDPLFTLAFDGEDFCDGTYRWDGSGLSRIE